MRAIKIKTKSLMDFLFIAVIVFNLTGCIKEGKNDVVHPTAQNIIDKGSINTFIDKTNLIHHAFSNYFDKINTTVIGTNDKDKKDFFGEIIDLEIDNKHNIWIVDSQNSQIKIFDMNKNFISAFGSIGDGPNEFRNIVGIEIIGDSLLTAEGLGKIKIFKFNFENKQETFKLIDQYTVHSIDDFCHTKNYIFISGVHTNGASIENGNYIHRINNQGKIDLSFGELYKSKNWLVSLQLSRGSIECNPDNNLILSNIEHAPYIHAFNESGKKTWIDQIKPFQHVRILSGYRGTLPYIQFQNQENHDRIINFSILENKNIAIQILESNQGIIEKLKSTIDPTLPLYNIVLNIKENKPILVNKGFDYKIESMSEKHFVGYQNHPYPHVIIIKK